MIRCRRSTRIIALIVTWCALVALACAQAKSNRGVIVGDRGTAADEESFTPYLVGQLFSIECLDAENNTNVSYRIGSSRLSMMLMMNICLVLRLRI